MSLPERRISLVWLALIVLTLTSSGLAESGSARRFVIIAIFALAAGKALLVASYFMEVDRAAPHWRSLYKVWIVLVAAVLAASNLMV